MMLIGRRTTGMRLFTPPCAVAGEIGQRSAHPFELRRDSGRHRTARQSDPRWAIRWCTRTSHREVARGTLLDRASFEQVENRPQRASELEALRRLYIASGQIGVMTYKDAGNIAAAPEIFRNGHVELRRTQIRQVVQVKRGLVAVDSLDFLKQPPRGFTVRLCQVLLKKLLSNGIIGLYVVATPHNSGCRPKLALGRLLRIRQWLPADIATPEFCHGLGPSVLPRSRSKALA